MEKCTFCVQRIREAKDNASREDREINDGEITPACAQACPTSAIVFGDLKDSNSQVSEMWAKYQVKFGKFSETKENKEMRGYRILEELNIEPSVTYLDRIREDFNS